MNIRLKISNYFRLSIILVFAAGLAGCGEHHHSVKGKLKVGDQVPSSNNLTVEKVEDWHQVSTMDTKVPLYKWKIADLLDAGKPFLVVFGTPQHCTMCVDQIVRIAVMEEKMGDQFAFVHIDGYKDNDVWVEWGVTGEPWTYIVDGNGEVVSIFPGQTELALIETAVNDLLEKDS